jgi:hypothetical protein
MYWLSFGQKMTIEFLPGVRADLKALFKSERVSGFGRSTFRFDTSLNAKESLDALNLFVTRHPWECRMIGANVVAQ